MNPIASVIPHRHASVRRLLPAAVLTGMAIGLFAARVEADGPTIPAAWQGVWNTTTIERVCGNPAIVNQESQLDTLCAGQPIFRGGGLGLTCSGTATDTHFDWTCSSTEVVFGQCTATVTFAGVATRTGDSEQTVVTITTQYSAGCGGLFPDTCQEFTSTGTRTADVPHCGQVAIEPMTWSSIKGQFR
jgi:hypothetical protein